MIANKNKNSPEDELSRQAKEGLENRIKNFINKKKINKNEDQIKIVYSDRLRHEINIINSMDYASYFLIVSDYIKWAKKILFLLDLVEVLEQAPRCLLS